MNTKFNSALDAMHDMYGIPKLDTPTKADIKPRLTEFVSILGDEFEELEAIIEAEEQPRIDTLVDLADFLGDVIVYCASEARRHGIPLEQVLEIIMDSNLSKLGADGLPILDHRSKIIKGPNYWKPEPKIRDLIRSLRLAKGD